MTLALDFNTDGPRRLDDPATIAVWTGFVYPAGVAFVMTLAGDLHDSELRNGEDVVLGLVVGHSGFHFVENLSLITFVLHVDEVDDDQSTQVAKAHLAGDFHSRFRRWPAE